MPRAIPSIFSTYTGRRARKGRKNDEEASLSVEHNRYLDTGGWYRQRSALLHGSGCTLHDTATTPAPLGDGRYVQSLGDPTAGHISCTACYEELRVTVSEDKDNSGLIFSRNGTEVQTSSLPWTFVGASKTLTYKDLCCQSCEATLSDLFDGLPARSTTRTIDYLWRLEGDEIVMLCQRRSCVSKQMAKKQCSVIPPKDEVRDQWSEGI